MIYAKLILLSRNKWHIYTGDEIGAILASYIIEEYKNNGRAMGEFLWSVGRS